MRTVSHESSIQSARVAFVFNHLLRRRLLRRRLLRRLLLLLLFELDPERSCDELVVVALRRRELRSQAADVGGSCGDRRHCRHCCNLNSKLVHPYRVRPGAWHNKLT